MTGKFEGITLLAMDSIRQRSKQAMYQRDPLAWMADVLGHHFYKKMAEIIETACLGDISRTIVKSSNGVSKSFSMADIICWWVSVYPPGDSLAIISAPSITQLEKVIFAYLKGNYATAMKRGTPLPGWIDEQLGWKYKGPAGNVNLALGRRPPEGSDIVSVFQGIRSQTGNTFIFFDEAGGLSPEMWTASEAILTSGASRAFAIGNPDNTGTEFHNIYRLDDKYAKDYNRFTISSFDLPTLTGERVYPRTPEGDESEKRMLAALTSKDWVEHKKRIWGEKDARYLSKVLGEFASEGSNAFFPQRHIDRAFNENNFQEDMAQPMIFGVDVARWGQDESVIYGNRGGRVRLVESWGKCDTYESEKRIHNAAKIHGAAEVRIDASGIGGAIFDHLDTLPEFADKTYQLIGIDGGAKAPDSSQHYNLRTYNHESLRDQLVAGALDLDYDDKELRNQLEVVTYRYSNRNSVMITPKDEMKTEMGGSPDRLDALIYACVDLGYLLGDGPRPGDVVVHDHEAAVGSGFSFYDLDSNWW